MTQELLTADETLFDEMTLEFAIYRSRIALLSVEATDACSSLYAPFKETVIDIPAIENEDELQIDFDSVSDLESFVLA